MDSWGDGRRFKQSGRKAGWVSRNDKVSQYVGSSSSEHYYNDTIVCLHVLLPLIILVRLVMQFVVCNLFPG